MSLFLTICFAWLPLVLQPPPTVAPDSKKPSVQSGKSEKQADKADDKADDKTDDKTDEGEGEGSSEAADALTDDGSGGWFSDLIHSGASGLLIQGGWFMLPILLMSIVAAGVIIERYRSLRMLRTDSRIVRERVLDLLREDEVEQALEFCNAEQGPVPAVLSAGIRKFLMLRQLGHDPARIEEQVVKAMDDYSVHIVAALEKHLPVLGTISSAAPMLGFLGTVAGMITSFNDIVEKMGETNIVESASLGISQALLTTCFGLIVGIPAFMAFNYFTSVINGFVLDVEESASELIETVTQEMALEQRD